MSDDNYEDISEQEFQEKLRRKGDILVKILSKAYDVANGSGLELIISVMAQKLTLEELKDVYITLDEYGNEILEYGETLHELNHLKEDDDESNRN